MADEKTFTNEEIHNILKEVGRDNFLIIARTWYHMIIHSYEDHKANMAMGMVEKYIPDFLDWLGEQEEFLKVKDVSVLEFINTMRLVGRLGEASLNDLITWLEKHEKSS